MKYTTINIQGNLISEDILQKIDQGDAIGQLPKDFGLEQGTNLRSEIEYAWSRVKLDWKHFSERSSNLPASDPYGTSLARRWMNNFLSSLNFELTAQKSSLQGDNNQSYAISHTAESLDGLPIHIVGFHDPAHPERNTLDIRSSGGTSRLSPHSTVQEYLNVTEHLYSLVTNGLTLRLIRDSGRLVKLTYVEFDLKRLLDEDKYSEFTLLYRLIHATRFPRNRQEADQCLLEKYYQDSIETGNRIRDGLSDAVKKSLVSLGNGFLIHPDNQELRAQLQSGDLTPVNFYRQLRRLIYRLLFLMVAEERDLIYDPEERSSELLRKKRIYLDFYSIGRLRRLSGLRFLHESQFSDLWKGLVHTFRLFEAGGKGNKLGIMPLDGDLFSSRAIMDIESGTISNQLLLECVRNLNEFNDKAGNLVSINYRALDVEELGSVYEGLLDLHPVINIEQFNSSPLGGGWEGVFTFHEGTDRKTTGSYYTRPDLVNELIKSALIPVIEERLTEARKKSPPSERDLEKVLLSLKVCDPASGSGHMLLAAARTIAWYLARVRSGEENPAPAVYRSCLRETIQHCVYGVDMNPDAVELCKLALWLESHNSGKPLSFLDHKIRCGNSLVGVTDLEVLKNGIPNEAFNPVTGDDKSVCAELKKDNQRYLKFIEGRRDIGFQQKIQFESTKEPLKFSIDYHQLESIRQDDLEGIQKIKAKFEHIRSKPDWYNQWIACNLWSSAFFYNYTDSNKQAAPTSERLIQFLTNPAAAYAPMVGKAVALAMEQRFFHWHLEFPDVFEQGGFDVMLGNPPWERIKLQQQEFYATRDRNIATAPNAAARTRMIAQLPINNPVLFAEYTQAMHNADATGKFLRESERYILTAIGDINTYSVFSESFASLINKIGKAGFIVPTGIATDDSNKVFFGAMVENNRLSSLFDFENREKIFKDVDSRYKFCLLTLSGHDIGQTKARFGFFLTRVENLQDKLRIFSLSKDDFLKLNPNTKTCPVFRTEIDAKLTLKLYQKSKVLIDENSGDNIWGVYYIRLIHYGDHANEISMLYDENTKNRTENVYEPKLFWQYDHRLASYKDCNKEDIVNGKPNQLTVIDKQVPSTRALGRYYASYELKNELFDKYPAYTKSWLMLYRDVSNSTNERTSISTIVSKVLASVASPGIGFNCELNGFLLCSNLNSLVYDYLVRQKVSGVHYNWGLVKQVPVIPITGYTQNDIYIITKNLIELIYSSWDIKSFADDVWKEADSELQTAITKQWEENKAASGGHTWSPPEWCVDYGLKPEEDEGCPLPPFKWDEERRALLKAELDAIYAKLYGLTTEELRYILDPHDVYDPDFPGETFRVLKEKEIRLFGEYRTRRLVLEAWERLNKLESLPDLKQTKPGIEKVEIVETLKPITMKEFSVDEGIYSVMDVAQISRLSPDKVRRWFRELSEAQYEGLSGNEKGDIDNLRISFHGLIELVVIGTLRENGFTLQKILKAREALNSITKKVYPFATNNVRDNLKASGKQILFITPQGTVTLDGTGQFNLDFIKEFFRNIEFDTDGLARRLFPSHSSRFIVIDPRQAGGKAVIDKKGVWVETIFSFYNGPESIPMLKDEYELDLEEIEAVLDYYNQAK
jgi:uncharacterized protein (DUF433 family)